MITIRGRTDKTLEKSWDKKKAKTGTRSKILNTQGETIKIKKETIKQWTMALLPV